MSLETEPPVDGDACSKLHFCSEKHDLNPHFTLSEEQEESRSCVRQAETFFSFSFVNRLFSMRFFDATGWGWGVVGCACDQVDQSHSSISSHMPELCLGLTDSVDDVSYQQCKQKPCLCKRQNPFVSTIYCLHNTGFQFVTNCLFCTVYSVISYSIIYSCHGCVLHQLGLGEAVGH